MVARGWGREEWGVSADGWASFGVMEMFWNLVWVVAQHWEMYQMPLNCAL